MSIELVSVGWIVRTSPWANLSLGTTVKSVIENINMQDTDVQVANQYLDQIPMQVQKELSQIE